MIIEFDMKEIMPACLMEKLHAERQEEKDYEAEIARKAEEERKANIVKQIIEKSNVIYKINTALQEHGSFNLLLVNNSRDNKTKCEWSWTLTSADWNSFYDLVPNVHNLELLHTLNDLYKKAGYETSIYEYSRSYYKDWTLTIYAKTNCETCEI